MSDNDETTVVQLYGPLLRHVHTMTPEDGVAVRWAGRSEAVPIAG